LRDEAGHQAESQALEVGARRCRDAEGVRQGFVDFRGYRTWYRVSGEIAPGTLPLLCLHGGPGSSSAYFHPLEDLAGRQVVVYDQLGCGESDRPDGVDWSLELFVDEVGAVREQLGLDRVHLLGQSWGGILAQQYTLGRPGGVCSLILSSTLSSAAQWTETTGRLFEALGPDATVEDYDRAHMCRLDPPPPEFAQWRTKRNRDVYHAMWGPNEWTCNGVLAGWDVRDRLAEIDIPTLVLRGGHDACTDEIAQTMVRGIAGAEYAVFDDSAHIPFVEESERYRAVLTDFLGRVEAGL
jgi:pimeloyl-ACP methyl ester carboxylesterase